jgi:hypothetical protein
MLSQRTNPHSEIHQVLGGQPKKTLEQLFENGELGGKKEPDLQILKIKVHQPKVQQLFNEDQRKHFMSTFDYREDAFQPILNKKKSSGNFHGLQEEPKIYGADGSMRQPSLMQRLSDLFSQQQ